MSKNTENEAVNDVGNSRIGELKHIYEMAIETRNFEINNLIQRNNFYMLFQGVLLSAVFSNEASKPLVEFVICCAGVFISWYQMKVSAGAKYWQEYWEVKVSEVELKLKDLLPESGFIDLFQIDSENSNEPNDVHTKITNKINGKDYGFLGCICKQFVLKKPSVSIYPLKTAFVLFVAWLFLVLQTIHLPSENWNKFLNNTAYKYIQGLYFNDTNNKQDDCEDSKTQCHKTNTE